MVYRYRSGDVKKTKTSGNLLKLNKLHLGYTVHDKIMRLVVGLSPRSDLPAIGMNKDEYAFNALYVAEDISFAPANSLVHPPGI